MGVRQEQVAPLDSFPQGGETGRSRSGQELFRRAATWQTVRLSGAHFR